MCTLHLSAFHEKLNVFDSIIILLSSLAPHPLDQKGYSTRQYSTFIAIFCCNVSFSISLARDYYWRASCSMLVDSLRCKPLIVLLTQSTQIHKNYDGFDIWTWKITARQFTLHTQTKMRIKIINGCIWLKLVSLESNVSPIIFHALYKWAHSLSYLIIIFILNDYAKCWHSLHKACSNEANKSTRLLLRLSRAWLCLFSLTIMCTEVSNVIIIRFCCDSQCVWI